MIDLDESCELTEGGWFPGDPGWNERQRQAEETAMLLIRENAEVWVEWLDGRIDYTQQARYVSAMFDGPAYMRCKQEAKALREEFTEYLIDGRFV